MATAGTRGVAPSRWITVTGRLCLTLLMAASLGGLAAIQSGAADAPAVPHLTPDSGQVVYYESTYPSSFEIGLVDADGWNPRTIHVPLTTNSGFVGFYGSPALSPDGSQVAFGLQMEDVNVGVGPCDEDDVDVINIDGSGFTTLPPPPGTTCPGHAVWSPSGNRLAIDATDIATDQPEVWTENPDGSDPILIGAGSGPSWSPDGTHLAFLFNDEIYSVGSGGGVATQLTYISSWENVGSPYWSPDGAHIAFNTSFPVDPGLSGRPSTFSFTTMLIDRDGSNLQTMFAFTQPNQGSDGPAGSTSWAPDGQRMLVPDSSSPAQGYAILDLQGRFQSSLDLPANVVRFANPTFIAAGGVAPSPPVTTPPVVGTASTPSGNGYWKVSSIGGVFTYGDAGFFGSMGGHPLNQPIVGMAATADGGGYWLVAADGGVFSFGDAPFAGSMGGRPLNQPIVGIADDPATGGYWEVAGDGGVFSFDAPFFGSTGNIHLNQPVVAMSGTADGGGYWFVAADGGVFAYGDAPFEGSTGNLRLNRPVSSMVTSADGLGYLLVASDGGIFAFGDAGFHGSMGSVAISNPIIGVAPDRSTGGYRMVASDGGTFDFEAPLD